MYFNNIDIENFSAEKKKVAIILTFRYSDVRPNDLYRIADLLKKISRTPQISTYIVDSGSPEKVSVQIRELCKYYSSIYIKVNTASEIFSIAKARNIGASYAIEDFIFFHDIDLIATDKFYQSLTEDINNSDWGTNKFNCYPCFYITEEATNSTDWLDDDNILSLLDDYYLGLDSRIQNPALASSCILVDRAYFLSLGGYDLDFYGHGFEDFELTNRLCHNYAIFPRPYDYHKDTKRWFTGKYEGFRSLFAMHGRLQLNKGSFLIHLWHPNDKVSDYTKSTKRNANLLTEKLKSFDSNYVHPHPLPDLNAGKSCALGSPSNLFYKSIRDVLPHFGELSFIDENEILDLENFYSYLLKNNIDRVIFPNPYGNEARLSIYRMLKQKNFPIIVSDRGALNNSYFFDRNGFNADSKSYDPELWDIPIPSEDLADLNSYIDTEISSDTALENQGHRQSPEIIKLKLGSTNKKVLFIPFQRPVDTVCKYFCGEIGSYTSFVQLVNDLSSTLDKNWIIVGKKHPLEKNRPDINGIIWADDEMHFKDLIYTSDAVLVINSGVGLLSLMWKKKVIVTGDSFYNHNGLTFSATSTDKIKEVLDNPKKYPDEEKIKRFIYYLRNKFYSFGNASVRIEELGDGHFHSATTSIKFDEIRISNFKRKISKEHFQIPINSGIFSIFSHYFENRNLIYKPKRNYNVRIKSSLNRFLARAKQPGFFSRNVRKLVSNPKSLFDDTKNVFLGY